MPTPFYHLSLAEELIHHSDLPVLVARILQAHRCEFLFGSTAPDVQVVSGQTREATHFFRLPVQVGDRPAWEHILAQYPCLGAVEKLPASQVAFLAGYLCHLQADWIWNQELFAPIFGPRCSWGTFHDRLYYHNILRAYLDRRILPSLELGMGTCLCQVKPDEWLPFVQDQYLVAWRDFLSTQLQPGAAAQTVEVFSSRQGIAALEYYALLESDERMQDEVFAHVSLERVEKYRTEVMNQNVCLVVDYLLPNLHPDQVLIDEKISGGALP